MTKFVNDGQKSFLTLVPALERPVVSVNSAAISYFIKRGSLFQGRTYSIRLLTEYLAI